MTIDLKRIRHGAALTLMGWYLLAPPGGGRLGEIRVDAPLTEWQHIGSFDTANACEDLWVYAGDHVDKVPTRHLTSAEIKYRIQTSMCIASDDPRLKGGL